MDTDISKMTDHDLLITLHEQVKSIKLDIKDLKDGTSVKIADHEARIRRLEFWGAALVGISYAMEIYFNFIHR